MTPLEPAAAESHEVGTERSDVLEIEFIDRVRTVEPGEFLTFGRSADLIVDDNPFLHRVVGRFAWRSGVWWVQNYSRRQSIEVEDVAGNRSSVGPFGQFSLAHRRTAVRFSGGPTNYELACEVHAPIDLVALEEDPDTTRTIDFGVTPLSVNQHLLLVSLSALHLSGGDRIPPSRVAASSLGWTITRFNRQLDHLCEKLHRAGVRGLCGDQSSRAVDRRSRLVDHALESGLVSKADLALLWHD